MPLFRTTVVRNLVDSIRMLVSHWGCLKWALSAPVITLKSFVKLRATSGAFQICAMPVKLIMKNDDEGVMKRGLCLSLHTVRFNVYENECMNLTNRPKCYLSVILIINL